VLHALSIPVSLTCLFKLYLAKRTSCEAPHYVLSSSIWMLHPSSAQIFSSANSFQTPSVYILPLMSEKIFTSVQN
jgi:hypothetical protein